MGRLDDTIANISYIRDCLFTLREIQESGSCNDCNNKLKCKYEPEVGALMRFNCPFYKTKCEMEDEE